MSAGGNDRAPAHPGGAPSPFEVQQYLAENIDLLEAAHERLNLGRLHESLQYQLQLQQNLIYLATHADEDPQLEPMRFNSSQKPAAATQPAQPAQSQADEVEGSSFPGRTTTAADGSSSEQPLDAMGDEGS